MTEPTDPTTTTTTTTTTETTTEQPDPGDVLPDVENEPVPEPEEE